MADEMSDAELAKSLVLNCVRNTFLEDLHAGVFPSSKTGDYTDVKVVSPYGEIPWANFSRISDEEMKALMIEVVDRVFTIMSCQATRLEPPPPHWQEPKAHPALMGPD